MSKQRDTRRQLILAAERLFAERGIEGVSLREINLAAQQRNTSAAHYHFGSKDALVEAIFEFRRTEIGRRREEFLDLLEREGRTSDLRSLAAALVMPLAPEMQQGEEGSRYLEFLAHVYLTSPNNVADILRRHQAGDNRWGAMIQRALPEMPRSIMLTRLYLMGRHVVTSLAAFHRRFGSDAIGFDAYVNDMLDAVAGYLAAPPSPQTLALVRARDEQRQAEQAAAPGTSGASGTGPDADGGEDPDGGLTA